MSHRIEREKIIVSVKKRIQNQRKIIQMLENNVQCLQQFVELNVKELATHIEDRLFKQNKKPIVYMEAVSRILNGILLASAYRQLYRVPSELLPLPELIMNQIIEIESYNTSNITNTITAGNSMASFQASQFHSNGYNSPNFGINNSIKLSDDGDIDDQDIKEHEKSQNKRRKCTPANDDRVILVSTTTKPSEKN